MKKHLHISTIGFISAFCMCYGPVTPDFNRVESSKLRVIGVSYLPTPDAVPGDTVTARAYFAGSNVDKVDNFALAFNAFGDETGVNFIERPLDMISSQSWLPDSFQFTFVIPDSAIVNETRRYNGISGARDSINLLLVQSKDSVISYLTGLPENERQEKMEMIKNTVLWSNTLFTAHAGNGRSLRVVSTFAIRYHSRFSEYLSVNHNPSVSWVAVYRVPLSKAMGFDPFGSITVPEAHKQFLFNAAHPDSVDTLVNIDTGFTYFLAGDNGTSRRDSNGTVIIDTVRDTEVNSNGELRRETYTYEWFYQNREVVGHDLDSLLVIDAHATGPLAEFKPPQNTGMRHFEIWVAVTDQIGGSFRFRPKGMAARGVSGEFTYSDAYKKVYY